MNINQLNSIYKVLETLKNKDVDLQAAFKLTNLAKQAKEQLDIFTEFSQGKEPESWTEFYKKITEVVAAHDPAFKDNFNLLRDDFYSLGFQKDAEEGYEKIKTLISENQAVIDEKLKSLDEINKAAEADIEVELKTISVKCLPSTLKPVEFEIVRAVLSETDEELDAFFEA